MSYKKIFVDNVACSRRFHITFDDQAAPKQRVTLQCPFCNLTIFSESNHPPVSLARQENLIQTAELSDRIIRECQFKDSLSERPVAKPL